MGTVLLAEDQVVGEPICVKVIRPDLTRDASAAERFLREGKLARRLRHRNIVAVFDVSEHDGTFFLTMEYLDGQSLRAWIQRNLRAEREVPLETAVRILDGILAGLAEAHRSGIVHRDLKPENVMLLGDPSIEDGTVKILEFGIARALDSVERLTAQGTALGTPIYMAPEQETGAELSGPEADLPAALDPIIEKALEHHPRLRFRKAEEFAAALHGICRTAGSGILVEEREVRIIDLPRRLRLELIRIPPGQFPMGSPEDEETRLVHEGPVHLVTIERAFWLGKYPVTQQQWSAVMGKKPSHFKGERNPVECVSWRDCQRFIEKLSALVAGGGFRLPTEAEWEYACRAHTRTRFSFGDDRGYKSLKDYAWYEDNSGSATHPVGGLRPNPWGLLDMHGNVWEWCQSVYRPYPYDATDGREETTGGEERVLRGGSWNYAASGCRSGYRFRLASGSRYNNIGLRVACTISGPSE